MEPKRTLKPIFPSSSSASNSFTAVVVALLWLSSAAAGQRPPVFVEPLTTPVTLEAGSRLSIIPRTSDNTVLYAWLKDGSVVSAASPNPVYFVASVTKGDAGIYQCNATNIYGSTLSLPIDVRVTNATTWQAPATPTQVIVKNGNAAVITPPSVYGFKTAWFLWTELTSSNSSGASWYATVTTAQLIVPQVSVAADNGRQFRLTLYQGDGTVIIADYALQIVADPSPSQLYFALPLPSSLVLTKGQQAVLECYPNARSTSVQWYIQLSSAPQRQALLGVMSSHYDLAPSSYRLTINSLSAADSGVYTCEALVYINNSWMTVSTSTQLIVQVPPTFVVQPLSETSPSPGSNVALQCSAAGTPQPNVTWFKDAKKLSAIVSSRIQIDSNGSLLVFNYSNSDSGNYQCFASNPAGTIAAASYVRYLTAPVITTRLPDTSIAVEGSNVILPCSASGNPLPTITWQKANQPLPVGSKYVVLLNQLTVVNAWVNDTAIYKCIAANNAGSDYTATSLIVYRPTIIVNATGSTVELLKLSSASLWCIVRADDRITPTIVWYKGTTALVTGPDFTLRDGNQTLYIPFAITSKHGGNYSCQVTSVAGGDARSFSVIVTEVPYPPSVIASLSTVRNRTIQVTWLVPYSGNKPILYYKLFQTDSGGSSWTLTTNQISALATNWDVNGLTPSQTYAFKLLAVNAIGDGQESSVTESVTIPAEPPQSPPQSVTISPRSSSLLLSFTSPDPKDWNGGLLGYFIDFKIPSVPWQQRRYPSSTAGQQTYLLDGMLPYQEYYVRLAAFNAQGTGPYTVEYKTKTLDGVPSDPPVIVSCIALSSTAVQLTWAPPSDPTSLNGEVQGYYVSVYGGSQPAGQAMVVQTVSANVLQYQFSSLSKFTTYTFSVAVFTRGGSSPASLPASVTTLQDRPGSVTNLTVLTVNHRSITVSWSLPLSPNGILTGYSYDCLTSSSGDSVLSGAVDNVTTSASCDNLTSSTTYDVRVLAATAVGQGPYSVVRAQTLPPPELPGAVGQPSVVVIGSTSAAVRFALGYDGKAPISAYIVQAQIGASSSWTEIWVNSGSASSFEIKQLLPYTRYVLRIIAQNIVGRSAASQPCAPFTTQQDAPNRPPGNVTARPKDATTLVITWTPLLPSEWNGPSEAYLVSYWPRTDSVPSSSGGGSSGGQPTVRYVPGAFTRALVLDSLAPWTTYMLCVAASNQQFNGSCSPAVSSSTLEGVPSVPPSNVTAVSIDATTVVVSWIPLPASSARGVVLGYSLWYGSQVQPAPSGAVVEIVAFPSGSSDGGAVTNQQYVLPGLRPCEVYAVRVAASTRAGRGPYSDPAATVLLLPADGAMPAPVGVYCPTVAETVVTVAWSQPPTACRVMGYTVSYWPSTDSTRTQQQRLPADASQTLISGLSALSIYVISVAAIGQGDVVGRAVTLNVMTTTVRSLPNAPVHVTVTSMMARSATVSWYLTDDPRAPVRNYTVYVRRPAVGATWTVWGDPVVAPSSECQIVGLRPNTNYEVRLTASNDVGVSEASPVAVLQTPSAAPDAAPTNVQVVPVTSTALSVQWDDLSADQWNGMRVLFNVSFNLYWAAAAPTADASNASGWVTASYPARDVILDGLLSGFVYEVRVAAVSDKGVGPQSLPVAVYVGVAVPTTQPAHVQVTSAGPTSIYVQWQGLTSDQLHGDLLGYKVYYKKVSGVEAAARKSRSAFSPTYDVVPPEEQQHTIVGLQEFATYAVVVAAFNLAGEGPYSSATLVTTQTSAPGVPASITIVPVALAVANITWTPPTRPNGVITGYRVTYSLRPSAAAGDGTVDRGGSSSSTGSNVREMLVSNAEQCLLSSLNENVTYSVSVAARTSAGWGNASTVDLSTSSAAGSPAKPFDVRFAQLTTTVTVSWTVVDSGRSPVTGYVVEALPKNGAAGDWQLVVQQLSASPEATLSSGAILGGQPFERLRVSVFNDFGVSPAGTASEGELPIYKQWWFLVMIALIALVIIVTVVAALCCECYKRRARKAKQAYHNQVFDSTEMRAEGSFSPVDSRQSVRRSSQRSQRTTRRGGGSPLGPPPPLSYVGSPHMGSTSFYPDEPPPHYEEEARSSGAGSSTEKRSFSDDEVDDDDYDDDDVKQAVPSSDLDEEDGPARRGGRSGRGSAQAGFNHFQYAGGHYATPSVRKSWRDRQKATRNVYNYTDSEADSYYGGGAGRREPGSAYQSHPVPGMPSSGRVTLSDANIPGSRAPLPGFSSFV